MNELLTEANLMLGELFLGIAEDGLPVKLDMKEAPGPVFVIAQAQSNTHGLLMLAAASCRQSSPDRRLTVVTENLKDWQEINSDFVATPGDPRLAEHLNQIISQPDTPHLLIVEGLEHCNQMLPEVRQTIHALLQNGRQDANVQIVASVNPKTVPGGIEQLTMIYPDSQFIWGITKITEILKLQPNEFLVDGVLKFSLPKFDNRPVVCYTRPNFKFLP